MDTQAEAVVVPPVLTPKDGLDADDIRVLTFLRDEFTVEFPKFFKTPELNENTAKSVLLNVLVALDIFRGVRKFAFPRIKQVLPELKHLTSQEGFPEHYPKILRPRYEPNHPRFSSNPCHVPIEDILSFSSQVKNIFETCNECRECEKFYKDHQPNNLSLKKYDRLLMISDGLFNQICHTSTIRGLKDILYGIVLLGHQSYSTKSFVLTDFTKWVNLGHCRFMTKLKFASRNIDIYYTNLLRIIPDPMTRRALLEGGELEGTCYPTTYLESTSDMRISDGGEGELVFLVNFTKKMLSELSSYSERNHSQVRRTIMRSLPKVNNTFRYVIVSKLPSDYVAKRFKDYRDFRLGKPVQLPYECIDIVGEEFNAANYVSTLAPTIPSQLFMRHFSGEQLLKVLESIPNFTYRFSQAQRDVIAARDNLVVIGRSGTGKTTCAVMRMLGIRLLEIAHANQKKGISKISRKDLEAPSYCKMVFITASPLLAKSVQKMYSRVIEYLKDLLGRKEAKKAAAEAAERFKASENKADEGVVTVEDKLDETFEVVKDREGKELDDEIEGEIKVVTNVLEDFDIKILDEAEREIDQMIGDIGIEDKEEVPNTWAKIGIRDFPLFLTLREFLYLMDSLLSVSFFERTLDTRLRYGNDIRTGGRGLFRHRENKTANRIAEDIFTREPAKLDVIQPDEDYSSDEQDGKYMDDLTLNKTRVAQYLTSNNPKLPEKPQQPVDSINIEGAKISDLISEVDLEDFVKEFWPEYKKSLDWKEVTNRGIDKITEVEAWVTLKNMYSPSNWVKGTFYAIQERYTNWKKKNGYFDLNDLAQRLNSSTHEKNTIRHLIDFMFVDEIQDIPVHILDYLSSITNRKFLFTGDNAQNITRGTNLSFSKLAEQYSAGGTTTRFIPLSLNYRSHQQILDLANNMVFHLKLYFANQVEFLPPESSKSSGPFPVVFPLGSTVSDLSEFMGRILGGAEGGKSGEYKSMPSQAIIVRDEESKEKALAAFPNGLILTILEAKGMEFEDVILFNYFSDSHSKVAWSIFKQTLQLRINPQDKMTETTLTKGLIEYCYEFEDGLKKVNMEVDSQQVKEQLERVKDLGVEEAADEIKFLYVGITRAKERLVIFDQVDKNKDVSNHARTYFDELWSTLSLIRDPNDIKNQDCLISSAKAKKQEENSSEKWIKKGVDFIKRGQFKQAESCFRAGACPRGELLARIYGDYKFLTKEYYSSVNISSSSPSHFSSNSEYIAEIKEKLRSLAKEFIKAGRPEPAINCFVTIRDLESAIAVAVQLNDEPKLASLYLEAKDYSKALECYNRCKDVVGAFTTLQLSDFPVERIMQEVSKLVQIASKKERLVMESVVPMYIYKLCAEMNDDAKNALLESSRDHLQQRLDDTKEQFECPPVNKQEESMQSVHEDDDEVKVVDDKSQSAEQMSVKSSDSFNVIGSFEEIQDVIEHMSESFARVSIEGDEIKSQVGSFYDVENNDKTNNDDEDPKNQLSKLSISELGIIVRMLKSTSNWLDVIKVNDNSRFSVEDENQVIEVDAFELSVSKAKTLIQVAKLSESFDLCRILEKGFGLSSGSLRIFVLKLLKQSVMKVHFADSRSIAANLIKHTDEIRRLSTLAFTTTMAAIGYQTIRSEIKHTDIQAKIDQALLGQLGHIRQICGMLSLEKATPIFNTLGDVHSMAASVLNPKELTLLLTASPLQKLNLLYSMPEVLRESGLVHFCCNLLLEPAVYEGFVDDVHWPNEINLLVKIAKLLVEGDADTAATIIESDIRVNMMMISGTIEAGILIGFLVQIFLLQTNFCSQKLINSVHNLHKIRSELIKAINYLYIHKWILYPKTLKGVQGLWMSFGISFVPLDHPSMLGFLQYGTMIHRKSPLVAKIHEPDLQVALKMSDSLNITYVTLEPCFVDPGQTFIAFPMTRVADLVLPQLSKYKYESLTVYSQLGSFFEDYLSDLQRRQEKVRLEGEIELMLEDEMVLPRAVEKKKAAIKNLDNQYKRIDKRLWGLIAEMSVLDWRDRYDQDRCLQTSEPSDYLRDIEQLINRKLQQPSTHLEVFILCIMYFNVSMSNQMYSLFPRLQQTVTSRNLLLTQA